MISQCQYADFVTIYGYEKPDWLYRLDRSGKTKCEDIEGPAGRRRYAVGGARSIALRTRCCAPAT